MAAVADESTEPLQVNHKTAADRYAKRTLRRSIAVISATILAALAGGGAPSSEEAAGAETLAETSMESTGAGEEGRPQHWGAMMRREPLQAASAATPASNAAENFNAVRRELPAHWGSMMRREERSSVVAESPAQGEGEGEEDRPSSAGKERPEPVAGGVGAHDVPSHASAREGRPSHWGRIMRRESAAAPPVGGQSTAMSFIVACQDMLGDWKAGAGKGRMLFFFIACVGFGLQVRDTFFSAIKASMHVEAGIGKKQ